MCRLYKPVSFLGFWLCDCAFGLHAQTSTLPQSHSSPGSRKAFPHTGPPKMRSVEGESSRQAGLTWSRNLLSCCWLQLLNSSGYTMLEKKITTAGKQYISFHMSSGVLCGFFFFTRVKLNSPHALRHDAASFRCRGAADTVFSVMG